MLATRRPDEIHTTNVVNTFSLGCSIDIRSIVAQMPHAFRFSPMSCLINFKYPHATCNMYPSGKVNVVGVADDESSLFAAWMFALLIQRLGYPQAQVHNFERCNMTSTVTVGHHLDLEEIANRYDNVTYMPSYFPGVRILPPNRDSARLKITIFRTGNMNLTGYKEERTGLEAYRNCIPMIEATAVRGAEAERELAERLARDRRIGKPPKKQRKV